MPRSRQRLDQRSRELRRPIDIRRRLRRQRLDVRDDAPHRLIDEAVHLGGVGFERIDGRSSDAHYAAGCLSARFNASTVALKRNTVTDVTALTFASFTM